MRIAHNTSSKSVFRSVGTVRSGVSKSLEKLSSGYRINRAADDAAGLAISEVMRSRINGLDQGEQNIQEGEGLCNVADGALTEVHSMLQRMKTLSIQAANGTYGDDAREDIQLEVDQLLTEIDRISDTTEYNGVKLFQGDSELIYDSDGNLVTYGGITIKNLGLNGSTTTTVTESTAELENLSLGSTPFDADDHADHLCLQAVISGTDSLADGYAYSLIFGDGGTSKSSFIINHSTYDETAGSYTTTSSDLIYMRTLTPYDYQYDSSTQTWSRKFDYQVGTDSDSTITITQSVSTQNDKNTDTAKYYKISYDVDADGLSTGDDTDHPDLYSINFIFNADTAYNNDDLCESYYSNGDQIEENSIYATKNGFYSSVGIPADASSSTDNVVSEANNDENSPLTSLSIINADSSLGFAEKIIFDDNSEVAGDSSVTNYPDVRIGHYNPIRNYNVPTDGDAVDENENTDNLADITDTGSTDNEDLGFSAIWTKNLSNDSTASFSFDYGIIGTDSDENLQVETTEGGTTTKTTIATTLDTTPIRQHFAHKDIWIQATGNKAWDGQYITINEMNTTRLGINGLQVNTREDANEAVGKVDSAIDQISGDRALIGAKQNRLEHMYNNDTVSHENLQDAESRIRDTDMAKEMANYTKENVLLQSGMSMLAQANQFPEGILQLLQQ